MAQGTLQHLLRLNETMQTSYNEFFFQVDKGYNPLFIDLVLSLGVEAVEERDGGVYVRSNEDLSNVALAVDEFSEKLSQIKNVKLNLRKEFSTKPNKDWILEYKKGVQPLQIGDFYIHSSWQEPKLGAINVQIDPALAFGSGHHESTHSCIELLAKFASKDDEALDVGCGSGILSIVLARLGCVVSACDTDEVAVLSALNNAKLNKIAFKELWQGSINHKIKDLLNLKAKNGENSADFLNLNKQNSKNSANLLNLANLSTKNSTNSRNSNKKSIKNPRYDLIVANLVGDIILTLAKDLKQGVKNEGLLVLSGIVEKYEKKIEGAFGDFTQVDKIKANEWLSFVYKKEK